MLTNPELAGFLKAIVALLLAAHCLGFAFERLRLPRVIGEILGGLLIGPSVLGNLAPGASEFLVSGAPVQQKLISALYWIGLTLLMFTAGFRVQHGFLGRDRRLVAILLVGATAMPFTLGWVSASVVDLGGYMGPHGSSIALALVIAIAFAVTSIPVISKIFLDLGLIEGRFARIVLATATLQDILLWAALAVATGLAGVEARAVSGEAIALVTAKTLSFCIVGLLAGPLMMRIAVASGIGEIVRPMLLGSAILWCFLIAASAAVLDVNVIFGAFIAGVALGSLRPEQMARQKEQIAAFAMAFFVPIYFAVVGFRINLPSAFDPALFFGFLIISTLIKGGSVFCVLRLARSDRLTAWNFAVAMNTRGGPGIVLASVAYEFGLVDERMFVALVLTSIATSFATGIWFRMLVDRGLRTMPD